MKKIRKRVSNKISNMNFILAFLIVLLHSSCINYLKAENSFYLINYVFQKSTLIITDAAVPLFFIMSGFLLFSGYQITNYSSLVRKKIKTILFPYLIWATIGWTFYACLTHIPALSKLVHAESVSFKPRNIIQSILLATYNPPIWFLRTLFILIIISPIIYWTIVKFNTKVFATVLLLMTIFLAVHNHNVGYSSAVFWLPVYIIAAWIGYYKSEEDETSSRKKAIISMLILFGFVALIIVFHVKEEDPLYYFYRIFSPFLLWNAVNLSPMISDHYINEKFNFSFFSFCTHIYFVIMFKRIFILLLGGNNFGITVAYLATGIVSFMACFVLSLVLKKITPKLYSLICGNR